MPGFSLILDLFWLLEGWVLHKGAWIATLLGTFLRVQDYKKVKFSGRDISSLAAKGLNKKLRIWNFHYITAVKFAQAPLMFLIKVLNCHTSFEVFASIATMFPSINLLPSLESSEFCCNRFHFITYMSDNCVTHLLRCFFTKVFILRFCRSSLIRWLWTSITFLS